MVKIIPMFSGILNELGGELPLITKILVAVSSFMAGNILILAVIITALIFGFAYWKKTENGRLRYDSFKLKLPLVRTTIAKSVTARFARSLSILLKSGISVISAMDIIKNLIGNRRVETDFARCASRRYGRARASRSR